MIKAPKLVHKYFKPLRIFSDIEAPGIIPVVGVASVLKMAVMLYCDCDVPVSTVSAKLSVPVSTVSAIPVSTVSADLSNTKLMGSI